MTIEQMLQTINDIQEKAYIFVRARETVKEWACEADENEAYDVMRKLCKTFGISIGWRYDE